MPKSTIELEKLLSLPSASCPVVSHDGRRVAFYWNVTGRTELYVADLPDGQPVQVTHGELPRAIRTSIVWNRAGTKLVFGKDVDGNERNDIWWIDVESGEVRQLTNTPTAWEIALEFSPSDRWLSFLSSRDGYQNLYKLDVESLDVVRLSNFAASVFTSGQWNPDGQSLLLSTNESKDLKNVDVYTVDAEGEEVRRIFRGREGSRDVPLAWLPDGKRVVVTSDASGVNRPAVVNVQSGDVRWLGVERVEEKACDVSKDGRHLLSLRNRDASITPVVTEIETGKEYPLIDALGFTYWAGFALDGAVAVIDRSTPTRKPELFVVPIGEGDLRSLTPIDYGTIDPAEFVEPSHIHYESPDGLSIPAILYEPRGTGGERPPAVVEIHGGPWGQCYLAFYDVVQYLVSRGFTVLQPNFRGSTGHGRAFTDLNSMDWGGGDLQDVVAGVEYLTREGKADPGRIAAYGGSYGGYMTYMALTKAPELWKAGVAWIGLTDLLAAYEESTPDMRYILRLMMGNPEENEDLWRDRSAIHFAENLKAKLLMIHGVNDARCPVSQARAFRDRLLELGYEEGTDFEYVELGKVGHGSSDIEERLETSETIVRYLEENV